MRVVCLHHRLGGYSSHHVHEARGFAREFGRRGTEFTLLVGSRAQPRIVEELRAKAVLEDPTFRLEWSFEERSRRFLKMLHRRVDGLVRAGDCLLVTISTQLEAHALTCWVEERPARKKPWVVVLFLSDRWNRSGRVEYERQIAEFRILNAAVSRLGAEDARRLIFCTLTDPLAAELRELVGTEFAVVPMPLPYDGATLSDATASPPRVAILGGTRREKGSYLIPDIVRACRAHAPVQFLVQLTNDALDAEDAGALGAVANEPEVSVIRDAMPPADYERALHGADVALFPYEEIPYRKRTSGVFAEAAAFGKPVVVTPGTWLAEQVAAGRAAGTIAERFDAEAIAGAVARCVAELEPQRRSAHALSAAWRARGLSAFVDYVESEIARRA